MNNVKVTLVVGFALLVAVGVFTLTRSPPRIVRVVGREVVGRGENEAIGAIDSDVTVCQANEVLPAGVSGVRIWLRAFYGTPVHLAAYAGSRLLTQGAVGAAWTGQSVTVPVDALARKTSGVTLCLALGPNSETMILLGAKAPRRARAVLVSGDTLAPQLAAGGGEALGGRLGIEYLAPGRGSWWSRIRSVARRLGLGRAFAGTWIALLAAALAAAAATLAVWGALRELS